jgi:hypothetical protein
LVLFLPACVLGGALCGIGLAAGGAKEVRGRELLYSGQAERKWTAAGQRPLIIRGSTTLSACVLEAEPGTGYALVLLYRARLQGKPGQPRAADEAEVVVRQVRPGRVPAPEPAHGPASNALFGLMHSLHVPFLRRADVRPGQTWREIEKPMATMSSTEEVIYTVVGKTVAAGHTCARIEVRTASRLPLQQVVSMGGMTLTEYRQTMDVDPANRQVVRETIRAQGRPWSPEGTPITLSVSAQLTLARVRQLSPSEAAARMRQVPVLERLPNDLPFGRPGTEQKRALADAAEALVYFRKSFPTSPYLPAVDALGARLRRLSKPISVSPPR